MMSEEQPEWFGLLSRKIVETDRLIEQLSSQSRPA